MDNSYLVLKSIIEQSIFDLNIDLGKEEFSLVEHEMFDEGADGMNYKNMVTTIFRNKKPLFQNHLEIRKRSEEISVKSQSYLRFIKSLIKAGIFKTDFIG